MDFLKREGVFYGVCLGLLLGSAILLVIALNKFNTENQYIAASDALRKTTQSGTSLSPLTREEFTTGTNKISGATPKDSASPASTATTWAATRKTPVEKPSKTPKPTRIPTPEPSHASESDTSLVIIDLPGFGSITLG